MKRRTFVNKSIAAGALPFLPEFVIPSFLRKERMGFSQATYAVRWKQKETIEGIMPLRHALDLLDHCKKVNAGGIQVGVGGWTKDFAKEVRKKCDSLDLYFEGQIRLPQEDEDISRFEKDLVASKEAGATVNRTACLSGRRYANFDSMQSFLEFKKKSLNALRRAEPIVRKHQVKLAVENHKDWRADELVDIIKDINSEWIGVTLDTGNNISFMEDPMEVIEKLAPYAYSTHIKDMAYQEYPDGILLSEVPLGEGVIDLGRAINVIKKYNPAITFNLEMITRDPLKVPCLTEEYWVTFDHASSGKELAKTLKNASKSAFDLPMVSNKNMKETLIFEEENNINSIIYAENKLGLS